MRRGGWHGAPPPRAGFQRHHLIPIALLHRGPHRGYSDVVAARVEKHPELTSLDTVVVTLRVRDTLKGEARGNFTFRQYLWDVRDTYDAAGYRKGQDFVLLLIAPAAVLAIFFIWPLVQVVIRSFVEPEVGLGNYARIFATTTYLRVIANTLTLAATVRVAAEPAIHFEQRGVDRVHRSAFGAFEPDAFERARDAVARIALMVLGSRPPVRIGYQAGNLLRRLGVMLRHRFVLLAALLVPCGRFYSAWGRQRRPMG